MELRKKIFKQKKSNLFKAYSLLKYAIFTKNSYSSWWNTWTTTKFLASCTALFRFVVVRWYLALVTFICAKSWNIYRWCYSHRYMVRSLMKRRHLFTKFQHKCLSWNAWICCFFIQNMDVLSLPNPIYSRKPLQAIVWLELLWCTNESFGRRHPPHISVHYNHLRFLVAFWCHRQLKCFYAWKTADKQPF